MTLASDLDALMIVYLSQNYTLLIIEKETFCRNFIRKFR